TSTPEDTVTGTPPTETNTAIPTDTPIPTNTSTATQTATASATAVTTLRIRDIQDSSHISPYNGTSVSNIPGIVTGIITPPGNNNDGFYLQDPTSDANDSTSEAIFVHTGNAPTVSVGNSLLVGGTVSEFRPGGSGSDNLTLTQIGGTLSITVISTTAVLPTPVVIGTGGRIPPTTIIEDDTSGSVETSGAFDPAQDGIDFYESLEAMRVQVNNPVAVGPRNNFGEIAVLGDDGANASVRTTRGGIVIQPNDFNPERIILDDVITSTPAGVDVGDHFTGPAVGIMDYGFGNFKLYITSPLTVVSGNLQQETAVPAVQGALSIGNYNVENLDPSDSTFGLHASAIITNLKAPDLLSIEEIQDNSGSTNDGTVAADETWDELIKAIEDAGGPNYEYRQINPVNNQDGGEPGGNIRVGLLFRTDRGLSFVDKPGGTSTNACTIQPDGTLTMSPCRVDPTNAAFNNSRKPLAGEFLYNGETIIVIANHFSSKGGDDPLFGRWQPPIRSTEAARHQQAASVNSFVDSILNADAGANVVVAGDINDFQFSETMNILETGVISGTGDIELQNLIETLPLSEQYTYVFDGNSQALDHALVSPNMFGYLVQYDVVHMNAEFDPQASDHDPSVGRFNMFGADTATPTLTAVPSNTSTSTTVPSSTSTSTSTATRTSTTVPSSTSTTAATAVPSATATACTIEFADVPPTGEGSTFYEFIRCLACRGIVGGYPCGGPGEPCNENNDPYYRPGANVTRGQLSKIIAIAAGLNDPIAEGQQQFADVPPGSPFYEFVERLAQTGAIAGYPCGGPGVTEPCDSEGRPYFRPNNPATRGQISKIVSIAAGFEEDIPSDRQTFTDVDQDSPFWVYIERLSGRGIISGYGEASKCPTGTPCFRYN
ncbi:MAG TPA: S-layer homology domain-containing protein, partial [Chloroflexia bacterium]|nr:S-layer homology domain-containing protein [Chloroflexia bacterium]